MRFVALHIPLILGVKVLHMYVCSYLHVITFTRNQLAQVSVYYMYLAEEGEGQTDLCVLLLYVSGFGKIFQSHTEYLKICNLNIQQVICLEA